MVWAVGCVQECIATKLKLPTLRNRVPSFRSFGSAFGIQLRVYGSWQSVGKWLVDPSSSAIHGPFRTGCQYLSS